MQETFIVSVKTEGGKLLMDQKISGKYQLLWFFHSPCFNLLLSALEDFEKSMIQHGSGTPSSVLPSPSPMEP